MHDSRHHGIGPTDALLRSFDAYGAADARGLKLEFHGELPPEHQGILFPDQRRVWVRPELPEFSRHDELTHHIVHDDMTQGAGEADTDFETRVGREASRLLLPGDLIARAVSMVISEDQQTVLATDVAPILGTQPETLFTRRSTVSVAEIADGLGQVFKQIAFPEGFTPAPRRCLQAGHPNHPHPHPQLPPNPGQGPFAMFDRLWQIVWPWS